MDVDQCLFRLTTVLRRRVPRVGLALGAAVVVAACEPTPPTPSTPPEAPAKKTLNRPPHPTMASVEWGEHVALELGKDVTVPAGVDQNALLEQARRAYHSLEPGAEERMRVASLQAWKAAPDDATRATGLAFAAVAMVTDPTVEGYRERLTDAYGLGLYAGTVDSSNPEGQAARAIVGALGGATRQARELTVLVATSPTLPEGARPLVAAAMHAVGRRDDEAFAAMQAGLRVMPSSWRVRLMLADRLGELGFAQDALSVIEAGESPRPAAATLAMARQQLAMGKANLAKPMAEELTTTLAGVDEPRRSEALALFAEAQIQLDDVAGATATTATLAARPGWHREVGLLQAQIALKENRVDDAKKVLLPLLKGTPTSPTDIERRIAEAAATVCAETMDASCFSQAVRLLQVVDVRPALVTSLEARVKREDKTQRDGPGLWSAIFSVDADRDLLLASRRAVQVGAPSIAGPTLDRLRQQPTNRLARALWARQPVESPREEAERALLALEGKGPPLADQDLLPVVDALAAFRIPGKGTANALAALEKASPSPAVQKMIDRVRAELADPSIRAKRLAEAREHKGAGPQGLPGHLGGGGDHGHGPPGGGAMPSMPSMPPMPPMPSPPGAP